MKKYFILSAAALALASCSNDEFLGEGTGQSPSANSSTVIEFGSEAHRTTRAGELTGSEAAKKLNGNFIVYGFKYAGSEDTDAATNDKVVFDHYNVSYTEGSDNTTESNTKGWEYVGNTPHSESSATEQSIKYWDYSADGYVFSAVSGTGITATKTTTGTTVYDKGWKVTIPAGGSLADLYASKREPIAKTAYQQTVTLTFFNLATKIRFGLYETIPGYSVQIKKVYYGADGSTTNFGVDGSFKTLSTDADAELTVTYYDNAVAEVENRPKVTVTTPADADASASCEFGTNIQSTKELGTTSNEATYDQAEGEYTYILPYNNTAGMTLKVDYTLTSTDGSKEDINVTGAIAKVPANFTNWKENFAYTYLFKISDNTNGSTGTWDDDNDPTTPEVPVVGLYPITFDACVIDSEDGIQETITSVADPSITTYQNGVIATKNDEYVAGYIYFENSDLDISSYHVYEVNNYGTEVTTEEVVANWKNNFCVLTEVAVTKSTGSAQDFIPLSDGTFIKKDANQAAKFSAEAGKTYVIVNNTADALDPITAGAQCKVVKVAGGPAAAVTYALTPASSSISTANGYTVLSLTGNDVAVLGAAPCFKVTKGGDASNNLVFAPGTTEGSYVVTINGAAVADGTAPGDYTVDFQGQTVTVTVGYTHTLTTPVDIEAGDATGADATLTIGGLTSAGGAVIVSDPVANKGITITDNGNGTYTVKADATVKNGAYIATIASETLTINVANYQFDPTSYVYNMKSDNSLVESTHVTLKTYEETPAAATGIGNSDITVSASGLTLTGSDGDFTVAATVGGTYTLTKANTIAKATVTVNKYALAGDNEITRSTGRAELNVTVNDEATSASSAKVKITKDADSSDQTANFTIKANGSKVVISGAKSTLDAGAYTVHYYLENGKTNEVATSALTVN